MVEQSYSWRDRLGTQTGLHFRVAAVIATLTAAISALRIAFNLGHNYWVFRTVDGTHASCCINFLESFLIPITIALILSVVGLWSRKVSGFFLSLVSFLIIAGIYVSWYFETLSVMRRAEIGVFEHMPDQSQHLLTLAYASFWDVYVLLLVIVLIMWQLQHLLALRNTVRAASPDSSLR